MLPASDGDGQICPKCMQGGVRKGVRVAAATKDTNAYEIVANLPSQSQSPSQLQLQSGSPSPWSFYWDCLFVAIHLRTVWHLVSGLSFLACTLLLLSPRVCAWLPWRLWLFSSRLFFIFWVLLFNYLLAKSHRRAAEELFVVVDEI